MATNRKGRKADLQVLVVDVGGTHVKLELNGQSERREFKSGAKLTAKRMVREVKRLGARPCSGGAT